jgi:CxxC-x17-CxxC domain-containing protein
MSAFRKEFKREYRKEKGSGFAGRGSGSGERGRFVDKINDRGHRTSRSEREDSFKRYDEGEYATKRTSRVESRLSRGGMYTVICEACGNECQVPFKPRTGKPVYCTDCFTKGGDAVRDDGGSDRRLRSERMPERRSFSSSSSEVTKEDLDKIHAKLDKIMKALQLE